MSKRKLILYISMSLDGFIATKNDDLSWLSIVESKEEDYGYKEFTDTVDTYIVGRITYEKILKLSGGLFPQAKQFKCYVITKQKRKSENGIVFYNGNIKILINKLKNKNGNNIYCDGGGQVAKLLMKQNLIDEFIISIIPIILGDGKRLFLGETPMIKLDLKSCKKYETGLIQLHYTKK